MNLYKNLIFKQLIKFGDRLDDLFFFYKTEVFIV